MDRKHRNEGETSISLPRGNLYSLTTSIDAQFHKCCIPSTAFAISAIPFILSLSFFFTSLFLSPLEPNDH